MAALALGLVPRLKRTEIAEPTRPVRTWPRRTREAQETINLVAQSHGREWAEVHAELILEQARSVGEI